MIILHQKYGQLANRIILISHFIAYVVERNSTLKVLSFDEYVNSFDCSKFTRLDNVTIRKSTFFDRILISLIYRFEFILPFCSVHNLAKLNHSVNEEFDIEKLSRFTKQVIIPEGWNYRSHASVSKNADLLRTLFQPSPEIRARISETLKLCKNKIKIAIHIRRGDYREWMGGKYYYALSDYDKIIQQLNRQFFGEDLVFLLFSTEELCVDQFTLNNLIIPNGTAVEDLFTMSECDYIIGPPSTYSLVAAFWGKTKLFHVESIAHLPQISEFKIIDSL